VFALHPRISPEVEIAHEDVSRPSVGIVLVNYNGWQDTISCIESLDDLEYDRTDIVVVDNGSTDESVAMLRKYRPDTELFETKCNLGFGGGCNVGARDALARGADYLWFFNNDATAAPDALGHMLDEGERDPRIAVVGGVVRERADPEVVQSWGGGRISMLFGIERTVTSRVAPEDLDWITGASMLVRAAAWRESGGFDETFFMYWEDADLCVRLRRSGWALAVAERSIVWHRSVHALGDNPRSHAYFNASAVRFFRRHARWPYIPIAVGLFGRMVKQLLRGRVACARAVFAGALGALRKP
jgi:GT2 family glycosyltransferase